MVVSKGAFKDSQRVSRVISDPGILPTSKWGVCVCVFGSRGLRGA